MHNADAGQPSCKAPSYGCSSSEGGRRRTSSVVAALPVSHRVTALLGRRWAAGGGPEGRRWEPTPLDDLGLTRTLANYENESPSELEAVPSVLS